MIAEREKDHVVAAHGLGAGWPRVVFRHILPNVLAPLIVQASVSLAFAILIEASLSYLGLGHPAARPLVGHHAQRGPHLPRDGAVDEHLPRASRSW